MAVREVFSLAAAIVVLAGISMAILNGGKTAQIAGATADGFANVIRAATQQPAR